LECWTNEEERSITGTSSKSEKTARAKKVAPSTAAVEEKTKSSSKVLRGSSIWSATAVVTKIELLVDYVCPRPEA
jgi:hypothetical protein